MFLTKKELGFLELYAVCTDQKSSIGKNFQLEKIDDTTVRFSQVTDNIILFTDVKTNSGDKFCFNYPTASIVQFLKTCSDDDKIEFIDNAIKLSNNAEYKFESTEYDISSTKEIFENVKNSFEDNSKVKIVELDKINSIKNYIGNEKGLDTVALMNNYFVASNRYDATACIKTSNSIIENFFLSKISSQLVNSFKIKEAEFVNEEDKYTFKIGNTFIIIPSQEYIIPNIFDAEFKQYYDFTTKLVVKKNDLLFALNRINIFARENINSRIFFTLKEKEIVIESKDRGYAVEKVEAIIDGDLVNHYIIVSSNYLINAVNLINTDNIIMKIQPSKEASVISIYPQGNEDMCVIQNLLEYID